MCVVFEFVCGVVWIVVVWGVGCVRAYFRVCVLFVAVCVIMVCVC